MKAIPTMDPNVEWAEKDDLSERPPIEIQPLKAIISQPPEDKPKDDDGLVTSIFAGAVAFGVACALQDCD